MSKSRAGGIYSKRKRNRVCVCAVCKQVFFATRSDAKTCSKAHRKALSRMSNEGYFSEGKRQRAMVINSAGGKSERVSFVDNDRIWVSVS